MTIVQPDIKSVTSMKEHASEHKLVRRMSNTLETLKKKKKKKKRRLPHVAKLITQARNPGSLAAEWGYKIKNKHALKMLVGAANSNTWTQ